MAKKKKLILLAASITCALLIIAGACICLHSHRKNSWYFDIKDTLPDGNGQRATVIRLNGEGVLKRRIMDMGITKGTEIFVKKTAPLGDPLELTVRGYQLSIRKKDAEMIIVE